MSENLFAEVKKLNKQIRDTPATRAKHYERRAKVVTPASFK